MQFLIVGTGRSGTSWIAEVLTAAGVPCGHEDIYGPAGPGTGTRPDGQFTGDASLYAVPYLDSWEGFVFHQVREPLACIGSIIGWKMFDDPIFHHGDHAAYFPEHWSSYDNPLLASVDYWVSCNRACEQAARYVRWQLEHVDADLIRSIGQMVGHKINRRDAQRAVRLPHAGHSGEAARGRAFARVDLGWDDIPDGSTKDEAMAMAWRYGYR